MATGSFSLHTCYQLFLAKGIGLQACKLCPLYKACLRLQAGEPIADLILIDSAGNHTDSISGEILATQDCE